MPMKSVPYQYTDYSPAEFELFRTAVQQDGFVITQNTIDTVSGHLGSLVYLDGNYNRNQRLLTVTIKSSPWQNFTDADVKTNVDRLTQRSGDAEPSVNQVGVKTPAGVQSEAGTQKPAVTPASTPAPLKVETPEPPKPAQTPIPAQTPKPADTQPDPAKAAATTPTESK